MSQLALELIEKEKKERTGKLDLGMCGLKDLDKEVPELFELEWLEELFLGNNYFDYKKITWKYSQNKGTSNILKGKLSENFSKLNKLTHLNLNGDQYYPWLLNDILVLQELKKLKFLDISFNELLMDISFLQKLPNLSALNICHLPKIKDFSFLKNFNQLKLVDLSYNRQVENFSFLQDLQNLIFLDLSGNKQIKDYSILQNLQKLRALCLHELELDNISFLKNFNNLHTLNLSSNERIEDYSILQNFNKLQLLDLNTNSINSISFLQQLQNLQSLDLRSNNINDITSLQNLQNLQSLDLRSNNINDISDLIPFLQKGIPVSMESLNREGKINLYNNPISTPPLEIVEQGNEAILEYFGAMKKSKSKEVKIKNVYNNEVKLILIGNSTAGKSTLCQYLLEGKVKKEMDSTHGMEQHIWRTPFSIEKNRRTLKELKVRILDFGGQEYYHDSHHLFFTSNTAYLLLWESETNHHDCELTAVQYDGEKVEVEMDHHPVEYWLEAIQYFNKDKEKENPFLLNVTVDYEKENGDKILKKGSQSTNLKWDIRQDEQGIKFPIRKVISESKGSTNTPVLVIQNKIDKERGIHFLNNEQLKTDFPNIHDFTNVSLHGEQRLEHLNHLVREVFEKMEVVGQELPGYWNRIKEAVEKPTEEIWMTKKDFHQFCRDSIGKKVDIQDSEMNVITRFLKNLNVILHYEEWEELADIIFVNPENLLGHVYCVLNRELHDKEGQFDDAYIKQRLKKYKKKHTKKEVAWLRNLMKRFHLIFIPPQEKETYIAPQYLPAEPDHKIRFFIRHFQQPMFRFQYNGFIHKSVVLHFFAEYGQQVLKDKKANGYDYYFWKHGIVLDNDGEIVLVEFDVKNSAIHIRTEKEFVATTFVEEIVATFERLNQNRKVQKLVSYNGEDFVDWRLLQHAHQVPNHIFEANDKIYRLGDFKTFLKNSSDLPMKSIFISYSSKDKAIKQEFIKHLSSLQRNSYISLWHDGELKPGDKWDDKIKEAMARADIMVFLISKNLLATDYIMDVELQHALTEGKKNGQIIVPIIAGFCDWTETVFGSLNALPEKAKPISSFPDPDEGWLQVVMGLKKLIKGE